MTARFLDIPYRLGGADFDGCDCYGLVRLYHRAALGVDLPAYPGAEIAVDRAEISAAAAGRGPWAPVARAEIGRGDVVLMSGGAALHCGVMMDARRFLHVAMFGFSELGDVTAAEYAARLRGVYRWRTSSPAG